MQPIQVEEIEKGNIWMLDHVFSEEECQYFLQASDGIGYEEAPVTVGKNSFKMLKDVRNNTRAMTDNPQFAFILYDRLKPYLPVRADMLSREVVSDKLAQGYELCGMNERIRFYKYGKGEYFVPHFDGFFQREPYEKIINGEAHVCMERSFMTVLLYLNNMKSGGATDFLYNNKSIKYSVTPKMGRVLMFAHSNYHQGNVHTDPNEFKHVMRSDVMYRKLIKKCQIAHKCIKTIL